MWPRDKGIENIIHEPNKMLNCKWAEETREAWRNWNCCGPVKVWSKANEKNMKEKLRGRREQQKVVSLLNSVWGLLAVVVVVNFTVDPLRRRRLIRTYKILYWFSLYARYFSHCLSLWLWRKFFRIFPHSSLAPPTGDFYARFYCWCKIDLFSISFPVASFYFILFYFFLLLNIIHNFFMLAAAFL